MTEILLNSIHFEPKTIRMKHTLIKFVCIIDATHSSVQEKGSALILSVSFSPTAFCPHNQKVKTAWKLCLISKPLIIFHL